MNVIAPFCTSQFIGSLCNLVFKLRWSIFLVQSYEVNSRGLSIFSKSWIPETVRPKAMVYYCHGYGDTCTFFFEGMWLLSSNRNGPVCCFVYCNRYWPFLWYCISGIARKLAMSGYGVFSMDYPGFGLSEGLHGFIPSFDRIVDDVIERYSKVKGVLTCQILLSTDMKMFIVERKLWNFPWNGSWGMIFCFIP